MIERKRKGRTVVQKAEGVGQKQISINSDVHERFNAAYSAENEKYPFNLTIQQFFTVLLDLHEENQDVSSIGPTL